MKSNELSFSFLQTLKTYLNEAKTEWLNLNKLYEAGQASEKNKDAELVVAMEKIEDLAQQLEQANVCLAESAETIETLEDELDAQSKKLALIEESAEDTRDQWNKSNAKYLVVSNEKDELKKLNDDQAAEIERLSKALADVTMKASESRLEIDSKNDMLSDLSSKLAKTEEENASLMQKLTLNSDETKTLREEMKATKSTLGDITDQINGMKVARINAAMQTSLVNDDEESETLVVVKVETNEDESVDKGAIISNVDFETKEKLDQLTVEYEDLKTKYVREVLVRLSSH